MIVRVVVACVAGALFSTGVAGAGSATPSRILFSADRAPLVSGEVYRVDARGGRVDLSRSPWSDTLPVSSADGSRVAFLSDRSGARVVYTVAKTGLGLRSVAQARSDRTLYAWSPDSSTLAVVALDDGQQTLAKGPLYIVRAGRVRKLAAVMGAETLDWTPDGRLVTYFDGFDLVARDPVTGRIAWQASPIDSVATMWTPRGLFAADDGNGRVVVYDQAGRLLRRFAGRGASWSPDGAFLASLHGTAVEIRDARLKLRRRVAIPGLQSNTVPIWTRPHVLFVSARGTPYDVDAATGSARANRGPWPVTGRSGPTLAWTTLDGARFAVHLQHGTSKERVIAKLPGCYSDGAYVPALDQLSPSADGTSVTYASQCYEPWGNLYALEGSRLHRITTAAAEQIEPHASPDGTRIAYSQAQGVGLSCKGCPVSLWVANADGSNAQQLTSTDGSFDDDGTWSPDGKTLLFARGDPSTFGELYTVPADGGAITPLHVAGAAPSWGPQRIAYLAVTPKGNALWTADPGGGNARRVDQGLDLAAPAWSRDGRLAFVTGRRSVAVWDGTNVKVTALPFASVTSVAWSPDGTRLAVAARAWGTPAADVYVVRTDGTHPQRLTTNLNVRDVSWG